MSPSAPHFRMSKDPWPRWRDLWSASEAGADPLVRKSGRLLFARGRQAIYFALKGLSVQPGEAVLVPSFICDSVTAPIRAAGVRVVFYRVRRDLSLDWSDIEKRIESGTRALLAVHYFGFPTAMRQCREFCDQSGLFLIEDCAHLLEGKSGGEPLGTMGDAAIFSWRKSLPLEDGGELLLRTVRAPLDLNWERRSILRTLKSIWHVWERMIVSRSSSTAADSPRWHSTGSKGVDRGNEVESQAEFLSNESSEETLFAAQSASPVSCISRLLLQNADLGKCAAKRRRNYLYLQDKLRAVEGVSFLHPSLPEGACPMLFPLFFDDYPNAHLALRSKGIPAVTWGGVRPPLLDVSEFPEAAFLYDNLVLLPVHQSLDPQDLEVIAEVVAEVRRERGTSRQAAEAPGTARSAAGAETSRVHW
jgi:perosamine synthetase